MALQWETADRPTGHPDYLGLAEINWDHFGNDAHMSYVIGHYVALEVAKKGDLLYAYAMNAFADHFLEDSFAAGHIRTPRRTLHRDGNILYDLCARASHITHNFLQS